MNVCSYFYYYDENHKHYKYTYHSVTSFELLIIVNAQSSAKLIVHDILDYAPCTSVNHHAAT